MRPQRRSSTRTSGSPASRAGAAWAPALLLVANTFLFSVLTIYLGNQGEFEFSYRALLPIHLMVAVPAFLLLLAAPLALKPRAAERYVSVLFVVGVLIWFQRGFLMWDYGVLDGRPIAWGEFFWHGVLDLSVWLVGIVLALTFAAAVGRVATFGSLVLVALQLAFFLVAPLGGDEARRSPRTIRPASLPPELAFYSPTQNVLHLVLDSAQTDIFLELIREGRLEDELAGFVLYEETLAASTHTSLAVPSIFAGEIYQGDVPPSTFYDDAMASGFHQVLHRRGFALKLTPYLDMREVPHSVMFEIPRDYGGAGRWEWLSEALFALDVALFRQSPHFLRRAIFDDNAWLLSRMVGSPLTEETISHVAFFEDYIEAIEVAEASPPVYHFLHLWPPHPPFVTESDGSLSRRPLPHARQSYKAQARLILRLVVRLLDRLRDLGIYDSSVIVVQGDHGSSFTPRRGGREVTAMPLRAAALLSVKPPGGGGKLRVSRLPTSAADAGPTILDLVGARDGFGGVSIRQRERGRVSERQLTKFLVEKSPQVIERYDLGGASLYEAASWGNRQVVELSQVDRAPYALGRKIDFGIGGNGDAHRLVGWCTPGGGHVWSCREEAMLVFDLETTGTDLELSLVLRAFVDDRLLPRQRVIVSVGGETIAVWSLGDNRAHTRRLRVPARLVRTPSLVLRFELPDAASPYTLGAGGDRRALGISLSSARIVAAGGAAG